MPLASRACAQEMRAKTLENKGQSQHELPQHGKSGGGGHFGVQPGSVPSATT